LGRGLDALLPAKAADAQAAVAPARDGVQEIAVDLIDRNPYQTRMAVNEEALQELAASILAVGVMQPVMVRPNGGRYQLIAGERRWLASQRAGKTTLPAVVKQVSNEQAMEMTIIENLQREDLNPMEQARAYQRLASEFGLTQEEMARRTGKDRTSISNFMRLLKLPEITQRLIQSGALSFGHGKALMPLFELPEQIEILSKRIADEALSVRQTESLVYQKLTLGELVPLPARPTRVVDPNVREAERALQVALGTKVIVKDRNGRGRIVIYYRDLEDFDRVMEVMGTKK
jgi:ParB family chromosome partitioning protein